MLPCTGPSRRAATRWCWTNRWEAGLAVAKLLDTLLAAPLPSPESEIRTVLSTAMMTPDDAPLPPQREWLDVLRG